MHNHFNYFFIAGSPFYSGCLYNALDTELDKFTNCFIQSWVDESQKLENNIKLDPKGESTDLRNELIKMQELIIKTRFKAINYLSQQ